MATVIRRKNTFNNKGFTLIELLVVTAVVGVLGVLSATLISSILRSQNKTAIITEVRQNGDLVISKFERDVKQSESVLGSGTSVTLTEYNGRTVIWDCTVLTRGEGDDASTATANAATVINIDPDEGVQVATTPPCGFVVSPLTHTTGVTQVVTVTFTLEQRSSLLRAEYQVSEQFQTTVGTRAY